MALPPTLMSVPSGPSFSQSQAGTTNTGFRFNAIDIVHLATLSRLVERLRFTVGPRILDEDVTLDTLQRAFRKHTLILAERRRRREARERGMEPAASSSLPPTRSGSHHRRRPGLNDSKGSSGGDSNAKQHPAPAARIVEQGENEDDDDDDDDKDDPIVLVSPGLAARGGIPSQGLSNSLTLDGDPVPPPPPLPSAHADVAHDTTKAHDSPSFGVMNRTMSRSDDMGVPQLGGAPGGRTPKKGTAALSPEEASELARTLDKIEQVWWSIQEHHSEHLCVSFGFLFDYEFPLFPETTVAQRKLLREMCAQEVVSRGDVATAMSCSTDDQEVEFFFVSGAELLPAEAFRDLVACLDQHPTTLSFALTYANSMARTGKQLIPLWLHILVFVLIVIISQEVAVREHHVLGRNIHHWVNNDWETGCREGNAANFSNDASAGCDFLGMSFFKIGRPQQDALRYLRREFVLKLWRGEGPAMAPSHVPLGGTFPVGAATMRLVKALPLLELRTGADEDKCNQYNLTTVSHHFEVPAYYGCDHEWMIVLPFNMTQSEALSAVANVELPPNVTGFFAVIIQFNGYQPSTGLYVHARVILSFPSGGGVMPRVFISPIDLENGGRVVPIVAVATLAILLQLVAAVVYWRAHVGFWDWPLVLDLANFVMIAAAWWELSSLQTPSDPTQTDHVPLFFDLTAGRFDNGMSLYAFYVLLFICGLVRYTREIRGLQLLFDILRRAALEIFGLILMFFGWAFGFICIAMLLFGNTVPEFSSFGPAAQSLLMYFFLQHNFDEVVENHPVIGPAFFFAYQLFVVFFALNLLIAVITAPLNQIKKQSDLTTAAYNAVRGRLADAPFAERAWYMACELVLWPLINLFYDATVWTTQAHWLNIHRILHSFYGRIEESTVEEAADDALKVVDILARLNELERQKQIDEDEANAVSLRAQDGEYGLASSPSGMGAAAGSVFEASRGERDAFTQDLAVYLWDSPLLRTVVNDGLITSDIALALVLVTIASESSSTAIRDARLVKAIRAFDVFNQGIEKVTKLQHNLAADCRARSENLHVMLYTAGARAREKVRTMNNNHNLSGTFGGGNSSSSPAPAAMMMASFAPDGGGGHGSPDYAQSSVFSRLVNEEGIRQALRNRQQDIALAQRQHSRRVSGSASGSVSRSPAANPLAEPPREQAMVSPVGPPAVPDDDDGASALIDMPEQQGGDGGSDFGREAPAAFALTPRAGANNAHIQLAAAMKRRRQSLAVAAVHRNSVSSAAFASSTAAPPLPAAAAAANNDNGDLDLHSISDETSRQYQSRKKSVAAAGGGGGGGGFVTSGADDEKALRQAFYDSYFYTQLLQLKMSNARRFIFWSVFSMVVAAWFFSPFFVVHEATAHMTAALNKGLRDAEQKLECYDAMCTTGFTYNKTWNNLQDLDELQLWLKKGMLPFLYTRQLRNLTGADRGAVWFDPRISLEGPVYIRQLRALPQRCNVGSVQDFARSTTSWSADVYEPIVGPLPRTQSSAWTCYGGAARDQGTEWDTAPIVLPPNAKFNQPSANTFSDTCAEAEPKTFIGRYGDYDCQGYTARIDNASHFSDFIETPWLDNATRLVAITAVFLQTSALQTEYTMLIELGENGGGAYTRAFAFVIRSDSELANLSTERLATQILLAFHVLTYCLLLLRYGFYRVVKGFAADQCVMYKPEPPIVVTILGIVVFAIFPLVFPVSTQENRNALAHAIVGILYLQYTVTTSVVFPLASLISKEVNVLIATLRKALVQIFYVAPYFVLCLGAFTLSGFVLFSRFAPEFSRMRWSFQRVSLIAFSDSFDLLDMQEARPFEAQAYALLILVTTLVTLSNLFLAMVTSATEDAKNTAQAVALAEGVAFYHGRVVRYGKLLASWMAYSVIVSRLHRRLQEWWSRRQRRKRRIQRATSIRRFRASRSNAGDAARDAVDRDVAIAATAENSLEEPAADADAAMTPLSRAVALQKKSTMLPRPAAASGQVTPRAGATPAQSDVGFAAPNAGGALGSDTDEDEESGFSTDEDDAELLELALSNSDDDDETSIFPARKRATKQHQQTATRRGSRTMTDDEEKRAAALRAARRSFGNSAESRGAPAIMTPNGRLFFPSEALLTVFSPLRINGLLQQFNHSDLGETAHAAVAPFLIDNAGRFESTNTARALQDARLQAEEEKLYAESWEAGIAFRFHYGVAHHKAARLERERDNFKRLVDHHFPFEDFDFSHSTSVPAASSPPPPPPPSSRVIPFNGANGSPHIPPGSTNSALPAAAVAVAAPNVLRRPAARDADADEEGTAPYTHVDTLPGPLHYDRDADDEDRRRRSSAQSPRTGPAGTPASVSALVVHAGRLTPSGSRCASPAGSRLNTPDQSPIVASLSAGQPQHHQRHRPPRLSLDQPTAATTKTTRAASMSMLGSGAYTDSAAFYSTEAVLGVAAAAAAPVEQEPSTAAEEARAAPHSPTSPTSFRRKETEAFASAVGRRAAESDDDDDAEIVAPAEQQQEDEAAVADDSLTMIQATTSGDEAVPGNAAASPASVAATMPPPGLGMAAGSSSVDGATLMDCFTRSPTAEDPPPLVGDWTTGGGGSSAPAIGVEPASGTASMNASASGVLQPFNPRKHVQAITTVTPQTALGDDDGDDDDRQQRQQRRGDDGTASTTHSPQKPPRSPRRSVAFDDSPVQGTPTAAAADQRPPVSFAPPTLTSWDDVLSYSRRNGVELPPSLLAGLLGSGDPPQPLLDLVAAVLHNAAVVQRDAAELAAATTAQQQQRQRTDSLSSVTTGGGPQQPQPPVGIARGKKVRLLLPTSGGGDTTDVDDANAVSNDGVGGTSTPAHGSFTNLSHHQGGPDRRLSGSLRRSPNPPLSSSTLSPNPLGASSSSGTAAVRRGVLRHTSDTSPMLSPASPTFDIPGEAGLDATATSTVAPPSNGRRKRREDRAASARRWSTVRAVSRVTALFGGGGSGTTNPNTTGAAASVQPKPT